MSQKFLALFRHDITSHKFATCSFVQAPSSDSDSDASTSDEVPVAAQNTDGTVTSAAQHELQIAAELAAQPAWFGGGRFGGREGKLARVRQQEALAAAKLGLALPKADLVSSVPAVQTSKKRKASLVASQISSPTQPLTEVAASTSKKARKRKDREATTRAQQNTVVPAVPDTEPSTSLGKQRIVVEPAFTLVQPTVPFVQTPASGWWGAKRFRSAGALEGIDQPQSQAERQQFDEEDQTNLYMAAQNAKTSAKKGLGIKSQLGSCEASSCLKHVPCSCLQP